MRYATSRTCSREIDFEVDNNNIVTSCEFIGGCMGNTQGVARLVVGRSVDDVIKTLEGINCGNRGTSCPDQLAQARPKFWFEPCGFWRHEPSCVSHGQQFPDRCRIH